MKRRTLLQGTLVCCVPGVVVGVALLIPRILLAAWPKSAFMAKTVDEALAALFNTPKTFASGNIKIKAPTTATDGTAVPVTISTGLKNIQSITILVEKNSYPLVAKFNLSANAEGFVSTRIIIARTSKLLAVVRSGGKIYMATRKIKVTFQGCVG